MTKSAAGGSLRLGSGKERRISEPATVPDSILPQSSKGRVLRDDLNIRIDGDGVWYYCGSRIDRKEIVCLFASVLVRDADGGYWLVTPTEMGRIEVEDAPFIAIELFHSKPGQDQVISLRTNVDEIVSVDDAHPLVVTTHAETGEPSPYVIARGGIPARLTRAVFYQLVELGVEEVVAGEQMFGVWSSGRFFPIGRLDGDS